MLSDSNATSEGIQLDSRSVWIGFMAKIAKTFAAFLFVDLDRGIEGSHYHRRAIASGVNSLVTVFTRYKNLRTLRLNIELDIEWNIECL